MPSFQNRANSFAGACGEKTGAAGANAERVKIDGVFCFCYGVAVPVAFGEMRLPGTEASNGHHCSGHSDIFAGHHCAAALAAQAEFR
jgi:hypothetical protein